VITKRPTGAIPDILPQASGPGPANPANSGQKAPIGAWPSPSGPAGYEIVWRGCTQPDWTHLVPVGNVTSATVPLAKDNVFFGIRAVDHDGHRSPVAFPVPSP
jgi:hypothetical protein